MPKSPRSKGQFFFISLMLIITFLSGLQALFSGFSEMDLSEPFMRQEDFLFWNIKDQVNRTIHERDCPVLESDFMEIQLMTKDYLARKGIDFILVNKTPICIGNSKPASITIEMNMTSTNVFIHDRFVINP